MNAPQPTWIIIGMMIAVQSTNVMAAQQSLPLTALQSRNDAACPGLGHILELEKQGTLADSQAALARRMAARGNPVVEDLVKLACMRLYLIKQHPPADSITYLTEPHSSWSYAALRAALLARSMAPTNSLPVRVLALTAVSRSGLRKTNPFLGLEWENHADDLPREGPAPDLLPVLEDLVDWVEADHGDWVARQGCMALALNLARFGQAHRCGVRAIAGGAQPAWQLLRLAWLALYTTSDSVTARAMVKLALDHTEPGRNLDLGGPTCTWSSRVDTLPGVDAVVSGLTGIVPQPGIWDMNGWRDEGGGCVKLRPARTDPAWPPERDVSRDRSPSSGAGLLATGWQVTDPVTGATMLIVTARIKKHDLHGEDIHGVTGKLLQWWLTDAGADSRVDSLVVPNDSTVIAIVPAISHGTGVGGWDLAIRQGPLKGAGAWDDRVPIVDSATLHLSDLLIGGNSADGVAVIGADSVRVTPNSSFRSASTLQLAFQVGASAATDSASVQLDVRHTDKHADRALRLAFPVRLAAGEQFLKYAIDLSSLKTGKYEIIATVTDPTNGTTVSRNTTFAIER